ncbi:hypothetical protein [Parasutterella muris]|nr:hypothetical protein [Parasutterella muris]
MRFEEKISNNTRRFVADLYDQECSESSLKVRACSFGNGLWEE